LVINKGLFTDGCKKLQKYTQIVKKITRKRMVFVEEFKDIDVMIVVRSLAQKEDQKTTRSYLQKVCLQERSTKSLKLKMVDDYLVNYKGK